MFNGHFPMLYEHILWLSVIRQQGKAVKLADAVVLFACSIHIFMSIKYVWLFMLR